MTQTEYIDQSMCSAWAGGRHGVALAALYRRPLSMVRLVVVPLAEINTEAILMCVIMVFAKEFIQVISDLPYAQRVRYLAETRMMIYVSTADGQGYCDEQCEFRGENSTMMCTLSMGWGAKLSKVSSSVGLLATRISGLIPLGLCQCHV